MQACKVILAKGFKKLPKVQKIAQSGHTGQQAISIPLVLQYQSFLDISSMVEAKEKTFFDN